MKSELLRTILIRLRIKSRKFRTCRQGVNQIEAKLKRFHLFLKMRKTFFSYALGITAVSNNDCLEVLTPSLHKYPRIFCNFFVFRCHSDFGTQRFAYPRVQESLAICVTLPRHSLGKIHSFCAVEPIETPHKSYHTKVTSYYYCLIIKKKYLKNRQDLEQIIKRRIPSSLSAMLLVNLNYRPVSELFY